LFGRLRRAGSEIGAPVHGESWICGVIYRAGLLGTMAPYILNMKFARSHSLLQLCLLAIYNLLSQAHAPAALVVQIGQNFTASTFGIDSRSQPADGNGAVGPSDFVEFINGRFAIFAKSTGVRRKSLTDLQFWKNAGVTFTTNQDVTDPRILFDTYSQRWFAAQIDYDSDNVISNRFLVAVSASADPTAAWSGFAFAADPVNGDFADFPTLGVDTNGVYLAGNLFDSLGSSVGSALVSFPKNDLLANPPSIAGRKSFGTLGFAARGFVLQPAATTGEATTGESVLAVGNLGLDFATHNTLKLSVVNNATTPGGATLSSATTLTMPAYSVPINPPQPDGTDNLDDGDARISGFIRRVGDMLYAVHGVQVNDRAAVRWYKINAKNNTLIQSGTISDTNRHFFFPSIAANENGIVAIAFNGSSSNSFVSSYAAVGEVVNGTLSFGAPILLKAGTASYQSPDPDTGISRWGDYSATSPDPIDPSRFWTIQMYPRGTNVWSTQVTELITKPLTLTITSVGQSLVISWPAAANQFHLEFSKLLSPSPDWVRVTQIPTVSNGQATVMLPADGDAGYFRLSNQ